MQVWYRVVAVSVKHGKDALQSLDYGHHLQAVAFSHLRCTVCLPVWQVAYLAWL